ncbi:hypothetical protein J6590_100884 [Homalodisca vitripennis]|nr:hypothetical protein J6590_100884 [Homalodisca vitripennis]
MADIRSHNDSNVQKRVAARRQADLQAADHIVEVGEKCTTQRNLSTKRVKNTNHERKVNKVVSALENAKESCQNHLQIKSKRVVFWELGLLTLPSLDIFRVMLILPIQVCLTSE